MWTAFTSRSSEWGEHGSPPLLAQPAFVPCGLAGPVGESPRRKETTMDKPTDEQTLVFAQIIAEGNPEMHIAALKAMQEGMTANLTRKIVYHTTGERLSGGWSDTDIFAAIAGLTDLDDGVGDALEHETAHANEVRKAYAKLIEAYESWNGCVKANDEA